MGTLFAKQEVRSSGSATDTNAVHVNASSEISGVAEKTIPIAADLLIIEDSAATNAKKKLQLGNLGFSSSNAAIQFNAQTISANLTIPTGQNAVSAGPITIADNITVTIADGSSWVIV